MSDRARVAEVDFQIVIRSFLFPATVPTAITVEERERICTLVLDAAILMRALVQRVVEGDVLVNSTRLVFDTAVSMEGFGALRSPRGCNKKVRCKYERSC